MEHASSKHLMECPACWADKLLQIERNSRRLNRATWNICSRSFSQLPIGEKKEREEEGQQKNKNKYLPGLPLFGAPQVSFIPRAINSGDCITAECHAEWKASQCFVRRRHTGRNAINAHFANSFHQRCVPPRRGGRHGVASLALLLTLISAARSCLNVQVVVRT